MDNTDDKEQERRMVEYGTIWSTADIFCHRCHKSKRGITMQNIKMVHYNLSLDICANCIHELAQETSEFRH